MMQFSYSERAFERGSKDRGIELVRMGCRDDRVKEGKEEGGSSDGLDVLGEGRR